MARKRRHRARNPAPVPPHALGRMALADQIYAKMQERLVRRDKPRHDRKAEARDAFRKTNGRDPQFGEAPVKYLTRDRTVENIRTAVRSFIRWLNSPEQVGRFGRTFVNLKRFDGTAFDLTTGKRVFLGAEWVESMIRHSGRSAESIRVYTAQLRSASRALDGVHLFPHLWTVGEELRAIRAREKILPNPRRGYIGDEVQRIITAGYQRVNRELQRTLRTKDADLRAKRRARAQAWLRKAVALEVMGCCGLRQSEVRTLTAANIDLQFGVAQVWGKGGRPRLVPIPRDLAERVLALSDGTPWSKPLDLGPITADGGQQVNRFVRAACQAAGVQYGGAHGFRHHYARTAWAALLAAGYGDHGSRLKVAHLLGHRGVRKTRRYIQRHHRPEDYPTIPCERRNWQVEDLSIKVAPHIQVGAKGNRRGVPTCSHHFTYPLDDTAHASMTTAWATWKALRADD